MKNPKVIFITAAACSVVALAMYLSNRIESGNISSVMPDSRTMTNSVTLDRIGTSSAGPAPEESEAEREYRLVEQLLNRGDISGGREHLERAVALDSGYAPAHNDLGVALTRLGLNEQAIGEYEAALRNDPAYAEASFNLGVAYNALGRTDDARDQFIETLAIDSTFYRANNNLGGLYALAGDFDQAISHLNAALAINPGFVDAHRNLASIYEYLGNTELAAEHRRAAGIDISK